MGAPPEDSPRPAGRFEDEQRDGMGQSQWPYAPEPQEKGPADESPEEGFGNSEYPLVGMDAAKEGRADEEAPPRLSEELLEARDEVSAKKQLLSETACKHGHCEDQEVGHRTGGFEPRSEEPTLGP